MPFFPLTDKSMRASFALYAVSVAAIVLFGGIAAPVVVDKMMGGEPQGGRGQRKTLAPASCAGFLRCQRGCGSGGLPWDTSRTAGAGAGAAAAAVAAA
jgi:hypothetical protein